MAPPRIRSLPVGIIESPAAQQGYEDYWRLGPRRSLRLLLEQYVARAEAEGKHVVPTLSMSTLRRWSMRHGWTERIAVRLREETRKADAIAIGSLAKAREQRLRESATVRVIGMRSVQAFAARLNELEQMNLVPRVVTPTDGPAYRIPGLLDYIGPLTKLLELGHKMEREELGRAEEEIEALLDRIVETLPDDEKEVLRVYALEVKQKREGR